MNNQFAGLHTEVWTGFDWHQDWMKGRMDPFDWRPVWFWDMGIVRRTADGVGRTEILVK